MLIFSLSSVSVLTNTAIYYIRDGGFYDVDQNEDTRPFSSSVIVFVGWIFDNFPPDVSLSGSEIIKLGVFLAAELGEHSVAP